MARPEGYRKAIRLMDLAHRFGLPVVTLVDTPGAYPGKGAEERGQSEAIARSTEKCLQIGVPVVSVVIGEGGSGCVYRAHDLLLDMQIAIKLLHPALYRNAQALGDLQSEARICMTLAHPNIVRLYNLDKRGGHYLLVMEYIDGPNLHTLLKTNPTPEPALFRGVIEAVAAALDEAHRSGVTHSDLTPGNILINSAGVLKLIDFGIAALVNQQAATGDLIAGTPFYMSPEQIRGEPVTPATDIFALGVIAYQMLTGYLPQAADATLDDLANHPRPPLVGISETAAAVIGRALAFDPAARWPTAGAFADALAQT
jgi:serine/threonine-protein kinase